MRRLATAALAAGFLVTMTLSAGEGQGKKPLGTWTRSKDESTWRFTFKADEIHFVSDGPLGKLEVEADYAVTKDGKTIFGRVRTVKEGTGPAKGDLLSFGFTVKGNLLTISDWKGTGVVGLAVGLQGEYQKAEAKKE